MALTFGGATSDRVNHGSGAALDDLDPFTVILWVYPTTLTAGRRLYSKNTAGGAVVKNLRLESGGNLGTFVSRSGSPNNYLTSDAPLSTDKWHCVAWAFDSAAAAGETTSLYTGDLTSALAERSYATASDGAGTYGSDATADLVVGNRGDNLTMAFEGRIARVAVYDRALTLGELRALQFAPAARWNAPGCVLLADYHGTGTQPDYSGNGNAGTVTGATVSAHVPLGPAFGADGHGRYAGGGSPPPPPPPPPPATYTGTASWSSGSTALSASATHVPPTYSGTASLTSGPTTLSAAAAHVGPSYTGAAAWASQPTTLSASASFAAPVYSGAADWQSQPTTLAASAAHVTPTYTGAAAWASAPTTFAATALFATAVYSGAAAWSSQPTAFAASAQFTAPAYSGAATWTSGSTLLSAAGAFAGPVYSGVAALTTTATTLSADATFAPGTKTGTAAWSGTATTFAAVATFTPDPTSATGPGGWPVAGAVYCPGAAAGAAFVPGAAAGTPAGA